MDYELQRCTRRCATTDREFDFEEEFYSALVADGADLTRRDYSVAAWEGPPPGSVGWWKSRMPSKAAKRMNWAPNDVMLQFFEELAEQPDKQDMRYILGLLLARRRVMRMEEQELDQQGRQTLVLYCPRREATYRVLVLTPDAARTIEIQEELARLLFAEGV